jgi:hypothetical protein
MPASDPVLLLLTPDVWTPVSTDILTGFLHIMHHDFVYYQTYRLSGNPAPTIVDIQDAGWEGVVIFDRQDRIAGETVFLSGAEIGAVSGIDVYILPATTAKTVNTQGKIRLDQGA